MIKNKNLNYQASSIHRIMFVLSGVAFLFLMYIFFLQTTSPLTGNRDAENATLFKIVFISAIFFFGHLYAFIGLRRGEVWGRRLSRFIGFVMLLGFPLGTFLGIYILYHTSKNNWQSKMVIPTAAI